MRAVVFDMDGVVFDTERLYRIAWHMAADDIGGLPGIDEDIRVCTGRNHEDIRAYFLGKYGKDFPYDRLMERRSVHIDEQLEGGGLPFKPGVPEIFDWLHANGYSVALATSTNEKRTGKYLSLSGIRDRFDRIITGNMVEHSKPRPDIYLLACRELGASPEESVCVEDSPNGLRAGHAAGMITVMIPDLIPYSDGLAPEVSYVCPDMDGLKTVLNSLKGR